MQRPDPKNYDFLWLVKNQRFLETSYWLNQAYRKRDFLITCKGPDWKTYIGKRQRARLAHYGITLLRHKFPTFKHTVTKSIREGRIQFKLIRQRTVTSLSNKQLADDFVKIARLSLSLWRLYFFTEYFLFDKVQELIEREPHKSKKLLQRVKEMQRIKFHLRMLLNQTIFKGNIFEKYFKEIQQRVGRKNIHSYHYKELVNLLSGRRVPVADRTYFVMGRYNKWQPLIGKQARRIIRLFDEYLMPQKKYTEIQGHVANRGFCRGRVKIIPFDLMNDLAPEIAKMKKGDVLVTGSTGPEMILACKKAGAIVTEEGGITSHAAIVSRELKIPCVIGTKIATQVFKDGDIIEVDAIKGLVKKIS